MYMYREAAIGQSFVYEGKPESTFDQCSLAMKKEGTFVDHLLEVVVGLLLFVIGIFHVINLVTLRGCKNLSTTKISRFMVCDLW